MIYQACVVFCFKIVMLKALTDIRILNFCYTRCDQNTTLKVQRSQLWCNHFNYHLKQLMPLGPIAKPYSRKKNVLVWYKNIFVSITDWTLMNFKLETTGCVIAVTAWSYFWESWSRQAAFWAAGLCLAWLSQPWALYSTQSVPWLWPSRKLWGFSPRSSRLAPKTQRKYYCCSFKMSGSLQSVALRTMTCFCRQSQAQCSPLLSPCAEP